jgi:2-iminobutanoate/2-iminopropanoate deaminase
MALTVHRPTAVHPTTGYSPAVQVGDVLYVAGQVSKDRNDQLVGKGDIQAQAEQVFENLKSVLESCGSSLDRIAKMNVYTTDPRHYGPIGEVRRRYLGDHQPASTFLVVSGLARPEFLLEIEVIAEAARGT